MNGTEKKQFYDGILIPKYEELKKLYDGIIEDPDWEFSKEKNKVKIYTKVNKLNGLKIIRGDALVHAPPSKIFETAINVEENKKWDNTVEDSKIIESLDDYYVIYTLFKGIGPLSKRETLTLFHPFRGSDGTIYGVGTSINHPEIPGKEGYVRVDVKLAGWVVRPAEGDPNSAYLTYILDADPQGKIPKLLINMVVDEQGMTVKKLGDYVEGKANDGMEVESMRRN